MNELVLQEQLFFSIHIFIGAVFLFFFSFAAGSYPIHTYVTTHPNTAQSIPQFNGKVHYQQALSQYNGKIDQRHSTPYLNNDKNFVTKNVVNSPVVEHSPIAPSAVVPDLRSSTPAESLVAKNQHLQSSLMGQYKAATTVPYSQLQLQQFNVTGTMQDREGDGGVLNATYSVPDKNNNTNLVNATVPKLQDFSVDSLAPYTDTVVNSNPVIVQEPSGMMKDQRYTGVTETFVETSASPPPPDLIMNNLEFKRTVRRWNTAKEKDDDFFEQEQRFLRSLQSRRTR